jgi:mycofactocin glycosyltransferase
VRPEVDVVVPVAGTADDVRALLGRLDGLRLGDGDSVTVVDNRGTGVDDPRVVRATRERGSYYARNRGAACGTAPWILFLDADIEAPPNLLDRLFATEPAETTAILAGAVLDQPPGARATAAVRYAALRRSMSQETTLAHGRWAFAQTASCAVRRAAFEAAGGFREGIRSGGDADLCWRLAEAGWKLEPRPGAAVLHRSRSTVGALLAQRARHGAGAAWLGREHPGALPRRPLPGVAWWAARRAAAAIPARVRGDRDAALLALLDGPAVLAFELGRLLPNRAPQRPPWRTLARATAQRPA